MGSRSAQDLDSTANRFASKQGRDALRTRIRLDNMKIHTTPAGTSVNVYRPEKDKLERSHSLLDIREEDAVGLTPKDAQNFWSTVMKPHTVRQTDDAAQTPTDIFQQKNF